MPDTDDNLRREEIRGLFVLGLIAVLATLRFSVNTNEYVIVMYGRTVNIIPFIDAALATWSVYAICMVFAFSKDIIGDSISNTALMAGHLIFSLSLIFFLFISVVTYIIWFISHPAFWGLGILIGLPSVLLFYEKLKTKDIPRPSITLVKLFLLMYFVALIILLTLLTSGNVEIIYTLVATLLGSLFFLLYYSLERRKKTNLHY